LAQKGKVRLHSHGGRNVMMDEEIATKENQGTHRSWLSHGIGESSMREGIGMLEK